MMSSTLENTGTVTVVFLTSEHEKFPTHVDCSLVSMFCSQYMYHTIF